MLGPTLSVVMPNYNHAHFLPYAVDALLRQSYKAIEIIIVDDGSSDNSVKVIQSFMEREPSIRLLLNERNRGVDFSINRGLETASGDYFYGAGADDRVLPGFFEKSMNLLAQYPEAGLCCSDPGWFDDCTGDVFCTRLNWSEKPSYLPPEKLAKLVSRVGAAIAGHSSIVRRSALLGAGGMIPQLKWHSDWFALHVVGFRHGICCIPEVLATMRIRKDSYSALGTRQWSQQSEVLSHLLSLLKSRPYRDVLPYFVKGNAMLHFGQQSLRLVMTKRRHWDYLSMLLIAHPLWTEPRRMVSSLSPCLVKWLYHHVRDRICKAGAHSACST